MKLSTERVFDMSPEELALCKQEFSVGDKVTFNAYHGRELSAKVVAVYPPGSRVVLFPDEFYRYRIDGQVISLTTGRSIMESKGFQKPTK